jgi:tetratricopeptide (TPR) repeat protein
LKRPLQHIIEEESRKAFAFLIPDGWVMNDFTKDYGKDINVEMFKDFRSTGKSFICQLKGTSQKFKDGLVSIQMELDTLRYYASVSTPILLVFYSTITKEFFGLWANSLITCYQVKEKQKRVTISMGEVNKLSKTYFESLPDRFSSNIFLKMNLYFAGESAYKSVIQGKVEKWLEHYFADFYEYDNFLLPVYCRISIDDQKGHVRIKVENVINDWEVQPAQPAQMTSFFRLVLDENELNEAEYELLFILSVLFAFYSPKAVLLLLSKCLHQYQGKYKDFEAIIDLANYAVESNCIIELQRLVKLAIKHRNFNDFQALNSGLFKMDKSLPELRNLYESNLKEAIEVMDNVELKGTFCYNLANHYRGHKEYFKAACYFNQARRYRPGYLQKHYWWHEYAGVTYLLEHYQVAAGMYNKSIEMDRKSEFIPMSYSLLADAEFMNMRFVEAEQMLDAYFRKLLLLKKIPDMQYAFLHLLCVDFIAKGYSGKSRDNEQSMSIFHQAAAEHSVDLFRESIEVDPLNYNSHFSLGLILEEAGEDDQAFLSYLATALITRGHELSFMKCLQIKVRTGDLESAFSIALMMVLVFGFGVLNIISNNIAEMDIPLDAKTEMLELIGQWEEKFRTELIPSLFYPKAEVTRTYD